MKTVNFKEVLSCTKPSPAIEVDHSPLKTLIQCLDIIFFGIDHLDSK